MPTAAYTGTDGLIVSLAEGVLSVTMNRPDSLNSLTAAMLSRISEVMGEAASDQAVWVVRLGGAGRGFSSGAGISDGDQSAESHDSAYVLVAANRAVASIVTSPKPVVAVVQGPAAGVGVSLALACDFVLASEQAYFLLAFTRIGLMPDGGATALVTAAIGRIRAMRMALLAERLPAADAFSYGLLTAVHPADELGAAVDKVIAAVKARPAG